MARARPTRGRADCAGCTAMEGGRGSSQRGSPMAVGPRVRCVETRGRGGRAPIPAVEIELQYLYRSSDAMMVPAELAGFALAESLSFEIVDSFWDTHDLELRRAGCSLRIRRQSTLPHPLLTWKAPSEWREDGARQREEVEVPIDHVPADAAEIVETLHRYHLWELVAPPLGLGDDLEL